MAVRLQDCEIQDNGLIITARPPSARLPEKSRCVQDSATLQQRLKDLSLREVPVNADGACQFRALAFCLFGDEERHGDLRTRICDFMEGQCAKYAGFLSEESFPSYISRMRISSSWGDHLTLQAASDALDVDINLVTSYPEKGLIEVRPSDEAEYEEAEYIAGRERLSPLWIGYWADVHYNPLVSTASKR